MNLTDDILSDLDNPQVFCEVGVYFYDEYCRLQKQINEGKSVILVEPLPPCIEDIGVKIKGKENVKLYPVAVADEEGSTRIYYESIGASAFIEEIKGRAPCHQGNYFNGSDNGEFDVPKVKFSSIDPGNIDVLLIDTEGMEYFALKHMTSRPQAIIVETHYLLGYRNPHLDSIKDWMVENGYTLSKQDESDSLYLRNDICNNYKL